MAKNKKLQKALALSIVAIILCVAMLAGTTFAWFTDSATSSGNRIQAGNLDVDLLMWNGTKYTSIADGTGDIFKEAAEATNSNVTLWEPGKTQVVYLAVENKGDLSLKYNILVNVIDGGLVGALEWAIIDGAEHDDDLSAETWADLKEVDGVQTGDIEAGITVAAPNGMLSPADQVDNTYNVIDYFALLVHMKEEAGNEYQGKDIIIDITVNATQLADEEDTFGKNYDEGAPLPWSGKVDTSWYNKTDTEFTLSTAEQLAGFAKLVNDGSDTFNGKTIKLGADMDLNNINWTPIGYNDPDSANDSFQGTFIGGDHIISNLYIVNNEYNYWAFGLFGSLRGNASISNLTVENAYINAFTAAKDASVCGVAVIAGSTYGQTGSEIKNVTVKNATVISNRYVAGIVGYMDGTVTDCTVENTTIIAIPFSEDGGTYYDGDKVGGIVGYCNSQTKTVTNNTVKDVTIIGYRDIGGIAGAANPAKVTFTNNRATNVKTQYITGYVEYDDDKSNQNHGSIIGRILDGTIDSSNTSESCIHIDDVLTAYANETLTEGIVLKDGDTLLLHNVTINAENGAAVSADGDVKIIVNGNCSMTGAEGSSAIEVNGDLTIYGDGALKAIGNDGEEDKNAQIGGSGISAKNITIDGLTDVNAEGNGYHAYGIGGDGTKSIIIKNTTVSYVKGGFVQPECINDSEYGKSEPEGGAAIGSGFNGAEITIVDSTIEEARGGSKAAAIGAKFWTGVKITIENSTIENAFGGNASAGIGGSRVSGEATNAENITITIKDSIVTAEGGQFGAGIGSGYNTHCTAPGPITTITITGNSVITAKGGLYGAGIGTGYHVAGLAGMIEESVTVNATNGGNRGKYTYAMDVGFGVVDKKREAVESNPSSFDYKGETITINSAIDVPEVKQ